MKKWRQLLTSLSSSFTVKESRETGQKIKGGTTSQRVTFFFFLMGDYITCIYTGRNDLLDGKCRKMKRWDWEQMQNFFFKREYWTVGHTSAIWWEGKPVVVWAPQAQRDGEVWTLEQPDRDTVGKRSRRSWQSHLNHALVRVLSGWYFNG